MWQVPRKPRSPDTEHGRVCSIYGSPLPPLRRILYIPTITETKKDSTLLAKLISLPTVGQSDG